MITAAGETTKGIANLWKRGQSNSFREFPNYGRFIPQDYMKMFMAGLPFLWADKKYWDHDRDSLPFDFIRPFIDAFVKRRTDLLQCDGIIMDESMFGWRPKTTKLGGLPHITYEPRKPSVNIGTMSRNGCDISSGIMLFQDLVDRSELQHRKKYSDPPTQSALPKKEVISISTAEVLRQVEGAKVDDGGYAIGDAWFGSVQAVVELRNRLNVFSAFIVKQNVQYFPKAVLTAILNARYER
jgi:hypothetical protein